MVFGEKLRSRKLTVQFLETVGAHEVRLSAEFALGSTRERAGIRARNAHAQLMDLRQMLMKVHCCGV